MAPSPDEMDAGRVKDKEAFVRQLPKRIAAIEDIWSKLHNSSWNGEQLEALYERIQEVSEYSKAFSLFQLNESVFSLEVYLSSFVGTDITPGTSQMDAIDGLMRAFKTASSVTTSAEEHRPATSSTVDIYILGNDDGNTGELGDALRVLGCEVKRFGDSDSLVSEVQVQAPKAIVADTAMLPEIDPLTAELVRLRTHLSVKIPLFFISSSTALQLRVDAIRAGGDGYFVAPLDAPVVAAQIRAHAQPDPQEPFRVLVVEDDPTQADFAASILQKAGIEALQVIEPVKVLDNLRAFKPDLILMDIYMPEVNGIELTTVIRDHKEFVSIPIVFLSGEQNTEKQIDALSVGGDDFISKPIRPKHLLGIVQTRIRRARQLVEVTGQPPKHDRVTGLFSRQHFLDSIAKHIDEDPAGTATAVLLVRPDQLPILQKTVGVGGLDPLLSEFGGTIAEQCDERDVEARIDEHTFGVLIHRDTREELTKFAEKLVSRVAQHEFADDVNATASVGLCVIEDRHDDPNGIISRARKALEETQRQEGESVGLHGVEADTEESAIETSEDLSEAIKTALRDDAFVIQYQPMLDLRARGSETYEVVIRVANARGDLIGGRQLLEAAETAGVCEQIDHWTLERAIDILKQRRDSGRRTQIFVHQSVHSALNSDLAAWLLGRLRAKQMVGTGLVIDFRLPDLSHNLKTAQHNIRALRDMDIDVSLSRFPEKDAAFKVLRFLRAGYINIAPRLLKADRKTISSVIRQAHDASAKVIVSNVDDPRSIDLHWSSGADFLQGNFIQRPLENMDYDFSQVVI